MFIIMVLLFACAPASPNPPPIPLANPSKFAINSTKMTKVSDNPMDSTDRSLLNALTHNARASITDLAVSLGLARSTVQSRLERLEATGAIAGYTIRLGEPARAQIRATVLLQLTPRTAPAVLNRLKPMPQVERAHSTSGRFDLIVQLACVSTTELDDTLDRIGAFDGVIRSETLIHLATKIDRAV